MTRNEFKAAKAKYIAFLPSSKADAETTRKNYLQALDNFETYLTENTGTENEISTVDILGYRQAVRDRGASQNTTRQYMTYLHTFFNWCVRVRLIDSSPVQSEDIPEETQIEYTLLDRTEIEKVLNYRPAGAILGARNRALITVLLQSGLRNSELRALTPADLDFEKKTITVRHGKGNKYRVAPFPQLARDAVEEYLKSGLRPADADDTEPLFGTYANENGRSDGKDRESWHEMGSNVLNDIVKRYVKRVTGKEIHTHILRHAAASLWDDLGAPMRTIQQGLGHSSIRTTERIYVTVLNKHKAAEDLTDVFGG